MVKMEENLVVIALGGNALLRRGEKGTFEEQYRNVMNTAKRIADLIERGYKVVITHGNGPQVGATMLRHDAGNKLYGIPAFPMDACGAETQGFIGYMIQQALRNELKARGIDKYVVTVITRVIVDKDDPAFKNPTKPVGPFYTEEEAKKLQKEFPNFVFKEDAGRGWRRGGAHSVASSTAGAGGPVTLTAATGQITVGAIETSGGDAAGPAVKAFGAEV